MAACACSARGGSSYQSNERIFVYEIPDVSHFDVEVGRPYLSYGRHFRGMASVVCGMKREVARDLSIPARALSRNT
jgi:hypothetical protein